MNLDMSNNLKIAVIGCGSMGALTKERTRNSVPPIWMPLSHTDAVQSIDDVSLVAVCDASEEQACKVSKVYPDALVYTDYKTMLDEVRPDIVGVATRTAGRCEIIRDCTEKGVRGIHAEKPLARSIKELRITLDVLEQHNVGFTFGAVRRYMAPYQLAREVAESGQIGEVHQIVIEHGVDMLLWGHPHSVDLAMFFNQNHKVAGVRSRLQIDPADVKGNIVDCDPVLDMAFLEFDNGVTTVITAGNGFNVKIFGSKGSVMVVGDGSRVELRKKVPGRPYELDHEELTFCSDVSGTKQAFMNLVGFVRHGADTGITTTEIESIHRVLFAMVLSELNQGQQIDPADVPADLFISGRFGDLYA
jgi:scyllo-inositol 2-dehydrogenase (NAD+)